MKRLAILLTVFALCASQAGWAQPGRPSGGGQDGGPGRRMDERRPQREEVRRESIERRPERSGGPEGGGRGLSHDEKRELRQQIRDNGRSIYRDRE